MTVILAVEPGDPALPPHVYGSVHNPRKFLKVNSTAETTAIQFASFCEEMCSEIELAPQLIDTSGKRYAMWDNLASHSAPIVYQTVEGRVILNGVRFEIVKRPAYRPWLGPIEFIFCQLGAELKRHVRADWTYATLHQEIFNVVAELGRNGSLLRPRSLQLNLLRCLTRLIVKYSRISWYKF